MENLGHICEHFMTQTKKAMAIIKGLFGLRSPLDLGNKKSLRKKLMSKKLIGNREGTP
jgi:hypothetical protein